MVATAARRCALDTTCPEVEDHRHLNFSRKHQNQGHLLRQLRNIVVAWRKGPRFWADAVVSVWELALANRTLRHTSPGELPLLPANNPAAGQMALSAGQMALLERVAYAVPIMAARVPWRSDCLVQALAARRWLTRQALMSKVCIGVRKDEQGFQAHAWLKVGERLVTGGDISGYAELPPAQVGRIPFVR